MRKSFRSVAGNARPLVLAVLSAAIAGVLVLPSLANASAFQLKENSAKSMGRAYAGSTTAGGDISVVASNPAAMSELDGTYFQADITAINFSAKFKGSAHDALGRPISGGNGGDAGTTLPVPAMFLPPRFRSRQCRAGFQRTVRLPDRIRPWLGRPLQCAQVALPVAGCDVVRVIQGNRQFSLGASAIAQKTIAELTNAINFNAVGYWDRCSRVGIAAAAIPPAQAPALIGAVSTLLAAAARMVMRGFTATAWRDLGLAGRWQLPGS